VSKDFTGLLAAVERNEPHAMERLLPVVYDQLKAMAAKALAGEMPGQTLSPTALVHEAYLRLSKNDDAEVWEGRRHFLGAAAQAMRRILIESARKKSARRGKIGSAIDFDSDILPLPEKPQDLLALDEALERLAAIDPEQARLVELRFFGGLTVEETAEAMDISPATVKRHWTIAKAWLSRELESVG